MMVRSHNVIDTVFTYTSDEATAVYCQPFGRGTGPIHIDAVECQGNETSIVQCNHSGWGSHNCDHNQDISVNCTSQKSMLYDISSGFFLLGRMGERFYIFLNLASNLGDHF